MTCDVFLRFVTGSSVCMTWPIHIKFNTLSGYGRRPISHTCGCVLELSTFMPHLMSLQMSSQFSCTVTMHGEWMAFDS